PMENLAFPSGATPLTLPTSLHLAVATPCARPPERAGWLHEIKYDGHRIVASWTGGGRRLISRNGHDRTTLFRAPFATFCAAGARLYSMGRSPSLMAAA